MGHPAQADGSALMFLRTESFHFSLFLLFLGTDLWLCPLPQSRSAFPLQTLPTEGTVAKAWQFSPVTRP